MTPSLTLKSPVAKPIAPQPAISGSPVPEVIIKSYNFAWNQYIKGFYKNLLSPNDNIGYLLDYQPLKLVSTRLIDFSLGKFITTSTGEPHFSG